MTGWIALGVLVVVIVAVLLYAMGVYNKLVKLRERCQNAFAQIDVQLKRRYDLIPNLVETAKGYMDHEKETLEAVLQARASATQAQINVNGDPTKAKEKLGWVPEITAQEMCAEMVAADLQEARRHALLKEHGLDVPVSLEG